MPIIGSCTNREPAGLATFSSLWLTVAKGFPEAIGAVFFETIGPTGIVHLIRNSMDFAARKDRKAIAAARKTIDRAKDADAGRQARAAFGASRWDKKYPAIAQSW